MEITKKILEKQNNINEKTPLTAFFGDSVTQGCFELYVKNDGGVDTEFEQNYAYHKCFACILSYLYPKCPVNIINAGISGDDTSNALKRMERDVLAYHPDLTVVCFGINDSNKGEDFLDTYYDNLKRIFITLKESGSEVIFMTPNMLNTRVSERICDESLRDIAYRKADIQNSGLFDKYIEYGKRAANECDVRICDVYSKWKMLAKNGVDTTELLSNKINHPKREMHRLFAYSLIEEIMK